MAYIKSFKGQNYLLPPKITDLFSKDHVCYFIDQIVDELDFSEFDKKYEGAGPPAYHPRIPIKLLLMGCVDGIFSSRKIAKNACENVVYIHLAEKTSPDFRTISTFRKENKALVDQVFLRINQFGVEQGLIDLSHLFIDGTSIKANASKKKVLDKETLEKLRKYSERMVEKGIEVDEEEDKLYGDRGMHQLPEEFSDKEKRNRLAKEIAEKINKAMKKPKELNEIHEELKNITEDMEKRNVKKYSFTDKDSSFMQNKKGGVELGYNAQLTVDKTGIIVANDVIQKASDRGQITPQIENVEKQHGKLKDGTKVGVDAGYQNGEDMQKAEEKGMDLHIPLYGEKDGRKFAKTNFTYDEERDVYICPKNKILTKRGTHFEKRVQQLKTLYSTSVEDCRGCPHIKECARKDGRRRISASPHDKLFNKIKKKMETPEGDAIYELRKQTVERSIGDIKENKKFRGFLLRGLPKVKIELNLACIAHNIRIMHNRMKMIRAAPTY